MCERNEENLKGKEVRGGSGEGNLQGAASRRACVSKELEQTDGVDSNGGTWGDLGLSGYEATGQFSRQLVGVKASQCV